MMDPSLIPAAPGAPGAKKRQYAPPDYQYDIVGDVMRAETRNLLKKYRVIVLPKDCVSLFFRVGGTNLPHRALDKVARESGAKILSVTLASRKPKEVFHPWHGHYINGDELLCIFLEGEGWKVEEEVVDNLLAALGLARESIEERYPFSDDMY